MNRGALDLLQSYGEDDLSEDDIIPGPRVSMKRTFKNDSEDEEQEMKLPVPEQFKTIKQIEHNQQKLSNGRIRSFPHERGNWASYIYVPFLCNYGIEELIDQLTLNLEQVVDLHTVDHFHISLTKTVVLKYHWINPFISTVINKIKGMLRFLIMFDCLEIYCNEEHTRTFIGLQIKTGYDSLHKLSKSLDTCLDDYGLETFYKDANFHMSILWCPGDKTDELKPLLPVLNETFQKVFENTDANCWLIDVKQIECKSGNKLFMLTF